MSDISTLRVKNNLLSSPVIDEIPKRMDKIKKKNPFEKQFFKFWGWFLCFHSHPLVTILKLRRILVMDVRTVRHADGNCQKTVKRHSSPFPSLLAHPIGHFLVQCTSFLQRRG